MAKKGAKAANGATQSHEPQLQEAHGDPFHNDRHLDLKADYVPPNPAFNDSGWRGELLKDDKRWLHGLPPAGSASFAWVQHLLHYLAPGGIAGLVLARVSSNHSGDGEIRAAAGHGRLAYA